VNLQDARCNNKDILCVFRTNNCSLSGALRKYPFCGAHQDLWALTVTRDKISFLAADYMKYGDLIGEMALSLRREGSNQKLIGIRSVFRLYQDGLLRNPF